MLKFFICSVVFLAEIPMSDLPGKEREKQENDFKQTSDNYCNNENQATSTKGRRQTHT